MTGTFMKMRRMRSRLLSPWRLIQRARQAPCVGLRVAGADEAASDFG